MNRIWKVVFAIATCATCVFGQAARTGTFVGTVTDSGGAIVPGAKVTVTNVATATAANGLTNEDGNFYVPFLAPGGYELSVEVPAFKKFVRKGLELEADQTARIDVKLEIGSITESVEVTASTPVLDTETSLVSQTFDNQVIEEIPILQMKAQRILYYMIGVASRGASSSILGQSINQLGYTLDGISGKQSITAAVGDTNTNVQPAVDAIEEVKTYTTGAPAEIGHAAGGMVAYTFKSGTNQIHGSAEDRYINKDMVHRNYLEQLPRTSPFTYHEMQGTLSGPVVFPKIYNGRNKTFFLFGYGRHHEKDEDPQNDTVPDANMLAGNFTFPQAIGGGFPIYDPATLHLVGTSWVSTQFPGNIIPMSRFDPVAVNFLALDPWQLPNNPGGTTFSRSGPSNNWTGYAYKRIYRSRFDTKIDQQLSTADKFFVRNSYNRHRAVGDITASLNNRLLDSATPSFGRPEPVDQQNWAAAEYHTFAPSLLNEMRFGYNRRVDAVSPPTAGQDWAQKLGIPNVPGSSFPGLGVGMGIGPGSYSRTINEDFTFQNNVTKVMGRVTFKFGYEVIRTRENDVASSNPTGSYSFGGTALPNVSNTGNGFANFLLGGVTSASFTELLANNLPRWWSHAGYAQADWKVRHNLTLNIGLRYSYETPYQTKWGQKSIFSPTGTDPLTGLPGLITHPKGPAYASDTNNFQPRFGLAWTLSKKVVFRGSFGLLTQDLLASAGSDEYTTSFTVNAPSGDPRPVFYLSQGPPAQTPTILPNGTSPFVTTSGNYSSRNASFFTSNFHDPYVMNWSEGFQIELGRHWMQEILYQGSAGVGLVSGSNINQLSDAIYSSTDLTLLNAVHTASQNYKPYTNYGTLTMNGNYGHSTYHALVARIEKRYSSGLTVNANYTLSKNLSGGPGDGWQYYDWRLTKAPTGFDERHRFIIMPTYELPVGKGRHFMSHGGWKDPILGGWNLSIIYTIISGPPVTFSYSGSTSNYLPGGPSRPNQISPDVTIPNWSIGPERFPTSAQNPLYNENAFAYPAQYTHGTLGAGTAYGLWEYWPQWTLSKMFTVHDRLKITLRLDGNNLPVKAQFTSPSTTVNFSTALSQSTFGKFSPPGTNFSTLGTDNGNLVAGVRLQF